MSNLETKFGKTKLAGGSIISKGTLSTRTQGNLVKLEELGYDFSDTVVMVPVAEHEYSKEGKLSKTGRMKKNFIISGTDPSGNPVTYVRRESGGRAAGQTKLYNSKGQAVQVSSILSKGSSFEDARESDLNLRRPYY